ncbi:phosphatase 2C-like domain-containing protein [Blyttiomyces helicus]|uniref:Phosphatase 2C-like domain-containing protein n=1 Tax=Blyttiomyces helicus TaxID=388810 RepID=A0A4P9WJA6_9FUNG|nr:phosphatase 2C-like domain-containing protein [Blyttiomyces helicus]|eukprot:RKO91568.1 phosphatase 2C-like domain-containing protein [Blyttiomyces helicus]
MPSFTYAASSDRGRRPTQQDAWVVHENILPDGSPSGACLFAVFDGHGSDGGKVAAFAQKQFPTAIASLHAAFTADPVEAIKTAFAQVSQALTDDASIDTYLSGTTVAMALLFKGSLVVAHLGDSRVVLGRKKAGGDEVEAVQLTQDHNCANKTELERVLSKGARVEQLMAGAEKEGPLRIFKGTLPYPGLVVTRALGDAVASRLGVLDTPEVNVYPLTPSDKFLIVGSDGVWDGLSSSDAVAVVSRVGADPGKATKELTTLALAGMDKVNVDDNSTNIVVVFGGP